MNVIEAVEALLKGSPARIVYVREEEVEEPSPGPLVAEVGLANGLCEAMKKRGVERLYEYQAKAIRLIMDGLDVVISSGAATGKTEAFLLPLLDRAIKEGARSLIVYPTKALAKDQRARISELCFSVGVSAAVYDGDTPEEERRRIVEEPPLLLITNPDMVHLGMAFSSRLRALLEKVEAVVLDEAHVYEGAFGSHMRMVLRRLSMLIGRRPQLIASSATIGNPYEFGRLLFDGPVEVIEGLPRRRGKAYHVLVSAGPLSRWTLASRLIATLTRLRLRVLCFTDSQQMAELLTKMARRDGVRAEVHRAGLPREDRVRVEEALRAGRIDCVVATPTLELGIDVGAIDAVVMASPPPSYTKYLQRAGRAGRRREAGYVFTVLGDDPIDAYYESRPSEFFAQELTPVVFEPGNEEVLKLHVLALALQLGRLKKSSIPTEWLRASEALEAEGLLALRGASYYPTKEAWRVVRERGLRGAGPEVTVYLAGRPIGFREAPMALHDLHPEAIYLHRGNTYKVTSLDLKKLRAEVKPIGDVPYYTRPLYEVYVEELSLERRREADGVGLAYGRGRVLKQVTGYATYSIYALERGKPESLRFFDEALSWSYETRLLAARYAEHVDLEAAHALEHALIHAARPIVGAGLTDLGGVSYSDGHVVIYDATPGGSGISRLLYERLEKAHRVALEILSYCNCHDGCPRCVYDPFCGNGNRALSRRKALFLLRSVLAKGAKASVGEPWGKTVARRA
ncbi:MAG: DEAD/DEAH box helicase [Candidatus Nezhaarchaeota archaeon]|nr:DEAD/DEAH box helicase [Candidatus Nezhaarchaeota archaeon]